MARRGVLTKEIRAQMRAAQKAARDRREARKRFYLSFSCKDSWDPNLLNSWGQRGAYRKYAWPILFPTMEAAQNVIDTYPVFANSAAIPGRGRIKSVCIESTYLPETAP